MQDKKDVNRFLATLLTLFRMTSIKLIYWSRLTPQVTSIAFPNKFRNMLQARSPWIRFVVRIAHVNYTAHNLHLGFPWLKRPFNVGASVAPGNVRGELTRVSLFHAHSVFAFQGYYSAVFSVLIQYSTVNHLALWWYDRFRKFMELYPLVIYVFVHGLNCFLHNVSGVKSTPVFRWGFCR